MSVVLALDNSLCRKHVVMLYACYSVCTALVKGLDGVCFWLCATIVWTSRNMVSAISNCPTLSMWGVEDKIFQIIGLYVVVIGMGRRT